MPKKLLLSIGAVWVFIFIFETLVHGFGLVDFYRAETNLFRSPEEGTGYFAYLLAGHLLLAIGITVLVNGFARSQSVGAAARLGAFLGLTVGGGSAVLQYVAQPMSSELMAIWMVVAVIEFSAAAAFSRLIAGDPA